MDFASAVPPSPRAGEGGVVIAPMLASDWPAVHAIYAAGIATGLATFESEPPSWEAFNAGRLPAHRIVAREEGDVLGWAAVSRVSSRAVYRGVVEHSIYVGAKAHGRGIGKALLRALISSTEADDIWTIQSSIFPENTASLALHQAEGFRIVGRRERIALMTYGPTMNQWRDTLLLERRSRLAGAG